LLLHRTSYNRCSKKIKGREITLHTWPGRLWWKVSDSKTAKKNYDVGTMFKRMRQD